MIEIITSPTAFLATGISGRIFNGRLRVRCVDVDLNPFTADELEAGNGFDCDNKSFNYVEYFFGLCNYTIRQLTLILTRIEMEGIFDYLLLVRTLRLKKDTYKHIMQT